MLFSCPFLPSKFFFILVFLPVSAEIRRKAIKSQPTAVDSPQILRLTLKKDSSCIFNFALSFRYDYQNTVYAMRIAALCKRAEEGNNEHAHELLEASE